MSSLKDCKWRLVFCCGIDGVCCFWLVDRVGKTRAGFRGGGNFYGANDLCSCSELELSFSFKSKPLLTSDTYEVI